jgi:hypothetical protein
MSYSGTQSTKYGLTKVETPPGSLYGFDGSSWFSWKGAAIGGLVYFFFFRKPKRAR